MCSYVFHVLLSRCRSICNAVLGAWPPSLGGHKRMKTAFIQKINKSICQASVYLSKVKTVQALNQEPIKCLSNRDQCGVPLHSKYI